MRKICSIVIALVMALTVFAIPSFGVAFAGEEDEVVGAQDVSGAEATTGDAEGTLNASAAKPTAPTGLKAEATENSVKLSWDKVESATGYEYRVDGGEWKSVDPNGTNYEVPNLESGKEYKFQVRAFVTDEMGTEYSDPSDVSATTNGTTPVAPTVSEPVNLTSSPGLTKITFKWTLDNSVDGYAVSRGATNKYFRDIGKVDNFTWTGIPKNQPYYFRLCAYKKPPAGMTDAKALELGATKINPQGTANTLDVVVFLSDYADKSDKPVINEKMVRKKFSKGYYYSYYQLVNGKWIKRGTSYDMWMKIKNVKSKTKYLIALDIKRNNVIIYKGKAGNWKVYKHFVVATGKKGKGTTHKGFSKISKRKIKFHTLAEHSKVGKKYTCWYATRYYGGQFFHSVLYQYNSKKKLHDGDVGCDKSHGCVRMKLGDAKWLYKNCKKGTVVVSSRTWNKHCSYGVWDATWK